MHKTIALFCLLLTGVWESGAVIFQSVIVRQSAVDVYSGPGRGFPIIHVVQSGESINILESKTDWIKIEAYVSRTKNRVGWVKRSSLNGASVMKDGEEKVWADEARLQRQFEFGMVTGEIESEPLVGLRASWRISEQMSLESRVTQLLQPSDADQWLQLGLQMHPFGQGTVEPYFTLGVGDISFGIPRGDEQASSSSMLYSGFGFRTRLTNNFVANLAYHNNLIYLNDNEQFSDQEWSFGFSLLFGNPLYLASGHILPEILAQNYELGFFSGVYQSEDFGSESLTGVRSAYHINEDLFIEVDFAFSELPSEDYAELDTLPDGGLEDSADLSYYAISFGFKFLPGEIVLSTDYAMWQFFYLALGTGNTTVEDKDFHTYYLGAGLRVYPHDRISVQLGIKKHYTELDLLGSLESVENLSLEVGLSVAF